MRATDDRRAWRAAVVAALIAVVVAAPSAGRADDRLVAEGVSALLDVMDAVAALHPGLAERTAALAGLPEADRKAAFAAARRRNESDAGLRAAIDRLLATATYRIYFRRFTNLTPELLADLLLDLPYRRRPAPGGVGGMLWELVRDRREVRAGFERFVASIDMERVRQTALRWVPVATHRVPEMHLIWDSNAGSFAAEGRPFLNLYSSGILGQLSGGDDGLRHAEAVMAHELHHVLAEPYLGEAAAEDLPWQARWVGRLTRGLVGEGLANHCNPPGGFKRELYEDETVLAALLARFEELLARLREGRMSEEEMRDWYRDNYFTAAETLLRRHLERRLAGDELEAMFQQNLPVRPDLEHALGWWMVSRISRRGERREIAVGLLSDPFAVYRLYDETIAGEERSLRLSEAALRDLEAFAGAIRGTQGFGD